MRSLPLPLRARRRLEKHGDQPAILSPLKLLLEKLRPDLAESLRHLDAVSRPYHMDSALDRLFFQNTVFTSILDRDFKVDKVAWDSDVENKVTDGLECVDL